MKKSLIALAVLASSGAAMAQSSVTIYGLVDVWVGKQSSTDNFTPSPKESQTLLNGGGWDQSRLGFRGVEDLGGGLKANFAIETGFSADAPGATTLGSRVAYVGLSGGFGEVQLGRVWTAYDDVWGLHNNGFASAFTARPTLGSSAGTLFGGDPLSAYSSNPNNGFKYISPSFGGFSAAASYAMGEDKNTAAGTSAGSVSAFNLAYNAGPVSVALGYQQEKVGASPTNNLNLDSIANFLAVGDKFTNTQLSGSYDLGVAKLLATYNKGKISEVGFDDTKSTEYSLGAEVPLSAAFSIGLGYGQAKFEEGSVEFAKTKAYSITGKYNMSKRTLAYAGYLSTKTTATDVPGNFKTNLYAVGIQHSF